MPRHEFRPEEVEALLVACHRRCCICHRFCGVKMEIDHVEGAAADASGNIANAIPLCFECHAEVHHYNPEHPRGRRLHASELKAHRDQWLKLCREHPEMFVHAQPAPEAGSLERLLNELEFNLALAGSERLGGMFEVTQFRRAIADGTFSWIPEELKTSVHAAYGAIVHANATVDAHAHRSVTTSHAHADIKASRGPIENAIAKLLETL
jgi:hypothetical protein